MTEMNTALNMITIQVIGDCVLIRLCECDVEKYHDCSDSTIIVTFSYSLTLTPKKWCVENEAG